MGYFAPLFLLAACSFVVVLLVVAVVPSSTWTVEETVKAVQHTDGRFFGGSTLLYFADGTQQRYDRGAYDWTINATYQITFQENGAGSVLLETIVRIN
jgi:hypothetical protein